MLFNSPFLFSLSFSARRKGLYQQALMISYSHNDDNTELHNERPPTEASPTSHKQATLPAFLRPSSRPSSTSPPSPSASPDWASASSYPQGSQRWRA